MSDPPYRAAPDFSAWVPGLPKTKGSMILRPNGTATQSVVGSTRWAILMAEGFRRALTEGAAPLDGPLAVSCLFRLPVDPIQEKSGDGDKLERNVWDALQPHGSKCVAICKKHAGVIRDDVLIVRWSGERVHVSDFPGVWVNIWKL